MKSWSRNSLICSAWRQLRCRRTPTTGPWCAGGAPSCPSTGSGARRTHKVPSRLSRKEVQVWLYAERLDQWLLSPPQDTAMPSPPPWRCWNRRARTTVSAAAPGCASRQRHPPAQRAVPGSVGLDLIALDGLPGVHLPERSRQAAGLIAGQLVMLNHAVSAGAVSGHAPGPQADFLAAGEPDGQQMLGASLFRAVGQLHHGAFESDRYRISINRYIFLLLLR